MVPNKNTYVRIDLTGTLEAFCRFWTKPIDELLTDQSLLDMSAQAALSLRLSNLTASDISSFNKALKHHQENWPSSPNTFLLLGHQQFYGIGVKINKNEALELYRKAGSHAAVLHHIAMIYEEREEYTTASNYYKDAIKKGYSSQAAIAQLYINKRIAGKNFNTGYKLLSTTANSDPNNVTANYHLGLAFANRSSNKYSLNDAIIRFAHAVANGCTNSLFNLAQILEEQALSLSGTAEIEQMKTKLKLSLQCYRLSATTGNADALAYLIKNYQWRWEPFNSSYITNLSQLVPLMSNPEVKDRMHSTLAYPFNRIAFDYHMAVVLQDESSLVFLFSNPDNYKILEKEFLQWDQKENSLFLCKAIDRIISKKPNLLSQLFTLFSFNDKSADLPETLRDVFYSMVACKLFESGIPEDEDKGLELAAKISNCMNVSRDACWIIGTFLLPQIHDDQSRLFVFSFLIRGAELDQKRQDTFNNFAQRHDRFNLDFTEEKQATEEAQTVSSSLINTATTYLSDTLSYGLSSFAWLIPTLGSNTNDNHAVSNNNNNTTASPQPQNTRSPKQEEIKEYEGSEPENPSTNNSFNG